MIRLSDCQKTPSRKPRREGSCERGLSAFPFHVQENHFLKLLTVFQKVQQPVKEVLRNFFDRLRGGSSIG